MTSTDRTLGGMTRQAELSEVATYLSAVADEFRSLDTWIKANVPRDPEAVVLSNILLSSESYLRVASRHLAGPISVFALATRSLYELMLHVRKLRTRPESLDEWQAECFTDHIELMEAILKLKDVGAAVEARASINTQIVARKAYMAKHGLVQKRPERTEKLAEGVGMKNDHEVFFKLLSKIVHPTSFLVNAPNQAGSPVMMQILESYLQICSWDIFTRIQERYSAPGLSSAVANFKFAVLKSN